MNFKKILIPLFIIANFSLFAFSGESDYTTIAIYDNKIPDNIKFNEKFTGGHPDVLDYVFIRSRIGKVRENPNINAPIIKEYYYNTKLIALSKINYYGNSWYKVTDGKGVTGYISANVVRLRTFRFQKALDLIKNLQDFIITQNNLGRPLESVATYVPNPNNTNLKRQKDKYGTSLDQNLVGKTIDTHEEIYIPDRSILSIVKREKNTSIVKVASIPEELIVPNNKLVKKPVISANFDKVVAIDVKNQNMMVFEKNKENIWEVISYVYSKTGIESQLGFETPKGFFIAPTAKFVMPYNGDGGIEQGYARYAIRFSGGGYLHGTPINYDEDINREFFMKQKEQTLGTFTGTRKCIRTTINHAKFLFDLAMPNPNHKANIQRIDTNIIFIIFS